MTWTAATTLTLHAHNNLDINAPITAVNGGLTVDAGGDINATGRHQCRHVHPGERQLDAEHPRHCPPSTRPTSGSPAAQFLRVTGGDGSADNPYQIADVYGLQGIGSSSSLLNGNYQLANNIDASGTASWNNGQGFSPIGQHSPPLIALPFSRQPERPGLHHQRPDDRARQSRRCRPSACSAPSARPAR